MTTGRIEPSDFELGLNSFGEVATDGGRVLDDAETVRLLVEEARLAEAVGWTSSAWGNTTGTGTTTPRPRCSSPRSPPPRDASGSARP